MATLAGVGARVTPKRSKVFERARDERLYLGSTIFRQLPVLTGNDSSDRKSDTTPRICDPKNLCPEIFKPLAQFLKISPNLRRPYL